VELRPLLRHPGALRILGQVRLHGVVCGGDAHAGIAERAQLLELCCGTALDEVARVRPDRARQMR
jgi:hypothetical protein